MTKISNEIKKIEKELGKLYSEKAKEENRYADLSNKLTNKYNDEIQTLKNNYTAKMDALKKENQDKMGPLLDEIAFFEKQKESILKLEAQIANLNRKVDERMGKNVEMTEEKGCEE